MAKYLKVFSSVQDLGSAMEGLNIDTDPEEEEFNEEEEYIPENDSEHVDSAVKFLSERLHFNIPVHDPAEQFIPADPVYTFFILDEDGEDSGSFEMGIQRSPTGRPINIEDLKRKKIQTLTEMNANLAELSETLSVNNPDFSKKGGKKRLRFEEVNDLKTLKYFESEELKKLRKKKMELDEMKKREGELMELMKIKRKRIVMEQEQSRQLNELKALKEERRMLEMKRKKDLEKKSKERTIITKFLELDDQPSLPPIVVGGSKNKDNQAETKKKKGGDSKKKNEKMAKKMKRREEKRRKKEEKRKREEEEKRLKQEGKRRKKEEKKRKQEMERKRKIEEQLLKSKVKDSPKFSRNKSVNDLINDDERTKITHFIARQKAQFEYFEKLKKKSGMEMAEGAKRETVDTHNRNTSNRKGLEDFIPLEAAKKSVPDLKKMEELMVEKALRESMRGSTNVPDVGEIVEVVKALNPAEYEKQKNAISKLIASKQAPPVVPSRKPTVNFNFDTTSEQIQEDEEEISEDEEENVEKGEKKKMKKSIFSKFKKLGKKKKKDAISKTIQKKRASQALKDLQGKIKLKQVPTKPVVDKKGKVVEKGKIVILNRREEFRNEEIMSDESEGEYETDDSDAFYTDSDEEGDD